MGVLDFGGNRRWEGAVSGVLLMGTLLRRCVEMRTVIELSFGVVSGVDPGIHVLDGSPRASRGLGCFWYGFCHFSASAPAIRLNGQSDVRNVFDSCVKS